MADSINDFADVIIASVEECIESNTEELERDARAAGNQAKRQLKQLSRERTGSYKKGWAVKVETDETGTTATVYNKTDYQLTHLLEKGHRITNQTGKSYGRAPGDGVIEKVFRDSAARFGSGGS